MLNGTIDSVSIYPMISSRKFVIYARSKITNGRNDLGLHTGDRICVSFSTVSQSETIGMLDQLMSGNVQVMAIADLPLQEGVDSKGNIEFKIKTMDAFTRSESEEDPDSDFNEEKHVKKRKKKSINCSQ